MHMNMNIVNCVSFAMFEVIFIEYYDILNTGINDGDKKAIKVSI
jgi:hypothetical protein